MNENYEGGRTRFFSKSSLKVDEANNNIDFIVIAKTGSALIFRQPNGMKMKIIFYGGWSLM
jgi:hypothetical protein